MKHSLVILFAFLTLTGWAKDDIVISQRNGYIAFEVDKGLTPIRDKYKYLGTGEQLAGTILYEQTGGYCKALQPASLTSRVWSILAMTPSTEA